jgi:hypothetical protein
MGLKFRRQEPIGHYVADFYCHESRLIVELDGSQHEEANRSHLDHERDQFFAANEIRVLRFSNQQLREDPASVLGSIAEALSEVSFPVWEEAESLGLSTDPLFDLTVSPLVHLVSVPSLKTLFQSPLSPTGRGVGGEASLSAPYPKSHPSPCPPRAAHLA